MKYDWETEEEFQKRRKEAKAEGICVFRNDENLDKILDIIDDYIDIIESLEGS